MQNDKEHERKMNVASQRLLQLERELKEKEIAAAVEEAKPTGLFGRIFGK
ncbi:hypothetical protein [Aneurinibacillus tyrosinisolvens]|nr:hypothetical protein [Aneurinibacillus tyrosinisolvens]